MQYLKLLQFGNNAGRRAVKVKAFTLKKGMKKGKAFALPL